MYVCTYDACTCTCTLYSCMPTLICIVCLNVGVVAMATDGHPAQWQASGCPGLSGPQSQGLPSGQGHMHQTQRCHTQVSCTEQVHVHVHVFHGSLKIFPHSSCKTQLACCVRWLLLEVTGGEGKRGRERK